MPSISFPKIRQTGNAGSQSNKSTDLIRVSTATIDRKSTRLNSSHLVISYAVFCLKKQNVNLGLQPVVLHCHVQQERAMQIVCLEDMVLDGGAVIGNGAVVLGAGAQQVGKIAGHSI